MHSPELTVLSNETLTNFNIASVALTTKTRVLPGSGWCVFLFVGRVGRVSRVLLEPYTRLMSGFHSAYILAFTDWALTYLKLNGLVSPAYVLLLFLFWPPPSLSQFGLPNFRSLSYAAQGLIVGSHAVQFYFDINFVFASIFGLCATSLWVLTCYFLLLFYAKRKCIFCSKCNWMTALQYICCD